MTISGEKCAGCGTKEIRFQCADCSKFYCSRECQVRHWPIHKKECRDRSDHHDRAAVAGRTPADVKPNVYVLRLQHGKYYVGRTSNPRSRLLEHFSGEGSAWTKLHAPEAIVEFHQNTDRFDEDKYTKRMMSEHGIDNVRGGAYSAVDLSEETKTFLERELFNADDKCYRCGKSGHFTMDCPDRATAPRKRIHSPPSWSSSSDEDDIFCYRCGRPGHISPDCYARTDVNGRRL